MPSIFGTPGNDTLGGGAGDTVFGDAGNDTITLTGGGAGYGEAGDDTFIPVFLYTGGQFGSEVPADAPTEINGGTGYDTVSGVGLVAPIVVHHGFYYGWAVNGATGDLDLILYGFFNNIANARPNAVTRTTGIERILLGGNERLFLDTYTRSIEIVGNALDNTLSGGLAADILRGGDGNDSITVGEGDRAYGDAGNDSFTLGWTTPPTAATLIDGGDGIDGVSLTLTGNQFDLIIGPNGFSIGQTTFTSVERVSITGSSVGGRTVNITGGAGSDVLSYAAPSTDSTSVVTLFGGAGDDTLATSRTQNDYLDGGDGNDTIRGYGTLLGGAGDDVITGGGLIRGGSGNDTLRGVGSLYGEDGDDVITMNASSEASWIFDGGDGVDTLLIQSSSSATARVTSVDLTAGTLTFGATTSTVAAIENVTGSSLANVAETFRGNASNNILRGLSGDDTLYGGGGDDRLEGGTGNDRADGDDGNDVLLGDVGNDVLNGGAGNDQLDGGAGDDTLTGGDGDDSLVGGAGVDRLEGGAGNDLLDGGDGGGQMFGGDGDDRMIGGSSGDYIDGGLGEDTAVFAVNSTDVTITRDLANYIIRGPNGLDTVTNVEHLQFLDGMVHVRPNGDLIYEPRVLTGTAAADRLVGWAGDDVLTGGAGEDVLTGLAGNDRLEGDAGQDLLYGGAGNDTLRGGANDDLLFGEAGDDTIDGGDGDDLVVINVNRADATVTLLGDGSLVIESAEGRDTLTNVDHVRFLDGVYDRVASGNLGSPGRTVSGGAGADRLTGTATADRLVGGAGNDVLTGGRGHDLLDGGAGMDTAVFSGVRRQYTTSATMVSGTAAEGSDGDGFDMLTGVELLSFVDGVLTYDLNSDAAMAMRLYRAVQNRAPDEAGLAANTAAVGSMGLEAVANLFVQSTEFIGRYGATNNPFFITNLYIFALGRAPDTAGMNAWLAALDNGMTRAQVVIGFSESAENVARTSGLVTAGLWVPDMEAQIIARMYDATLDRLPDPAGLAGWTALYDGGMSLTAIAQSFVGSPEFQARYGALSNQQFVEQLYRFCLDREGDAPGVQAWVNLLDNGASRAQVVVGFSESAEHIALTAPFWQGGIRYSGGVAPQPAPVEDALKDHDAQVSPHPTDMGALIAVEDFGLPLDDHAFVLPVQPGGFVDMAWQIDDALAAPLPMTLPHHAATDLVLLMPQEALFPGDPNAGGRDHLELNWA